MLAVDLMAAQINGAKNDGSVQVNVLVETQHQAFYFALLLSGMASSAFQAFLSPTCTE